LIVFVTKNDQSAGTRPAHQTVAPKIQFQSAKKSIQIEFTDQKLSPHAGTATFWSLPARIGLDCVVGEMPAAPAA
jgi:hypothetical protein